MYQRFLLEQVWERVGIDVEAGKAYARDQPADDHLPPDAVLEDRAEHQQARAADARECASASIELQVIQWEHAPDSATEALAL